MKKIILAVGVMFIIIPFFNPVPVLADSKANMITNASFEIASPQNRKIPMDWNKIHDTKNLAALLYPVRGQDGSKATEVVVGIYKRNEEGWSSKPISIQPGKQYTISDYYISSAPSFFKAKFKLGDGSTVQKDITKFGASFNKWNKAEASFTAPENSVSVTLLHSLRSIGVLTTDNFSLAQNTIVPAVLGASDVVVVRRGGGGGGGSSQDTIAPVIKILGDNPVNISVGATYTDTGATAQDNVDGDLTSSIKATSNVDATKAGAYTVVYSVSDKAGNPATATRNVNVAEVQAPPSVDTTSPVITILGTNPASIVVGSTYTDAGATALDNADGDLTSSIKATSTVDATKAGAYTVVYTVSDKAGNPATATRTVNVTGTADTTPPVITILGTNPTSIVVGSTYTDAGATALDNVDGDLTSSIVTVDNVIASVAGSYTVTYTAIDKTGNSATATRTVNVTASTGADTTAPGILMASPISGTSVSDTIIVKASSGDIVVAGQTTSGVKQVQFYVDGVAVGNPTSALPFSLNLDTTTFTDGSHILGAISTDNAGNNSIMAQSAVTFINSTTTTFASANLVLNPSLETGTTVPGSWQAGAWGTNDATFAYPVAGHTTNGAGITVTNYTDGDAKWIFNDVNITPSGQYIFSDFFKSTAPTTVTARFTLADGTFSYFDLGYTKASANWKQFAYSFAVPSNATSVTIFHLINSVGALTVDDFYLGVVPSSVGIPFAQGMVSINFDDGRLSTYQNAIPILDAAGVKSTQYIISSEVGATADGYTTQTQILDMQAKGHEIESHTINHPDLTTLTAASATTEITQSRTDLQAMGINPINTIAYPYGAWNASVEQLVKNAGYTGARTGDNYPGDFGFVYSDADPFTLKTEVLDNTTTLAAVEQWVNTALANKTWLILVFHDIATDGLQYSTTPTELSQIVNYLKTNNVKIVTNTEGLALMGH